MCLAHRNALALGSLAHFELKFRDFVVESFFDALLEIPAFDIDNDMIEDSLLLADNSPIALLAQVGHKLSLKGIESHLACFIELNESHLRIQSIACHGQLEESVHELNHIFLDSHLEHFASVSSHHSLEHFRWTCLAVTSGG